jgi:hypothetical protein
MIFIVEVRDKKGHTARKEYTATCLREALICAEDELVEFTHLYVNDVWQKGGSTRGIYGTENAERSDGSETS